MPRRGCSARRKRLAIRAERFFSLCPALVLIFLIPRGRLPFGRCLLISETVMKRKNSVFIRSLPTTASLLAEKMGIGVEFKGGTAPCTDSKSTICMPFLNDDADIGDRCCFLGSFIHECAHVRYTEAAVMCFTDDENLKSLLNAVEDVRIEKLLRDAYPGAAFMRCASEVPAIRAASAALDKYAAKWPEKLFQWYCFVKGNISLNGKTYYRPLFNKISRKMAPLYPEKLIDETEKLLERFASLADTWDSFRLARDLSNLFERYRALPELTASTESGATEAQKALKRKRRRLGVDPLDTSAGFAHLLAKAADKSVAATASLKGEDLKEDTGRRRKPSASSEEGRRLVAESRQCCAGLKRTLKYLVESQSRAEVAVGNSGRNLDYGRLSRLACWDLRIFRRCSRVPDTKTAFHILVDRSGSMCDGNLRTALKAAVALYEAVLSIAGTDPAISVFPGESSRCRCVVPHKGGGILRYSADLASLRSFGFTPFYEAVHKCSQLLNQNGADRRVLFVITDGTFSLADAKYIDDLKCSLRSAGVECAAIGLGRETLQLKDFFGDNFEMIENIDDLRNSLFRLSKKLLVKP